MPEFFKELNGSFSNQIEVHGKSYHYFGGTAYLGIPQQPEFLNWYVEGLKKYGISNGTSRSNNVQLGIYNEAEKAAATRFGSEAALITSSGYLAAQLAIRTLSSMGKVIHAPGSHPALWPSENQHDTRPFFQWASETLNVINHSSQKNWVIASNSMNNLFPEIYDFSFLEKINPDKHILLLVDDSHGIGINNNGRGAFCTLPKVSHVETIVVASMAKALGVDAGLILGSSALISLLKSTEIFLGASPPSAAGLFAFMQAEKIYHANLLKLQENIALFKMHLNNSWKYTDLFPVFLTPDSEMANHLLEQQILISSFPYPSSSSEPLNRVVLSSWHEKKDVLDLIEAIDRR